MCVCVCVCALGGSATDGTPGPAQTMARDTGRFPGQLAEASQATENLGESHVSNRLEALWPDGAEDPRIPNDERRTLGHAHRAHNLTPELHNHVGSMCSH